MKSSRIKITEDEHRLIIRYREQVRSYNEGVAAALALFPDIARFTDPVDWLQVVIDLRKNIAGLVKETL